MDFLFLFNSVLLGASLAMDAFSVSLANGIHEPFMRKRKMVLIAGTFGFFQFLMPLLGWICVHWVVDLFQSLLPYIPWISLVLLFTLGLMMIRDGLSGEEEEVCPETCFSCLLLQWKMPLSAKARLFPGSLFLRVSSYSLTSPLPEHILIFIIYGKNSENPFL